MQAWLMFKSGKMLKLSVQEAYSVSERCQSNPTCYNCIQGVTYTYVVIRIQVTIRDNLYTRLVQAVLYRVGLKHHCFYF